MKQLTQERRDRAMQDCTEWEEAEEECAIHHASSSTTEEKQWLPCENALVGRGQEAEEGRFFIIVASIILKKSNEEIF